MIFYEYIMKDDPIGYKLESSIENQTSLFCPHDLNQLMAI